MGRVFTFDVGRDVILLFLEKLQNGSDGCVSLAPRPVILRGRRPFARRILLAILQVEIGDAVMMLFDVRDLIITGGGEVDNLCAR